MMTTEAIKICDCPIREVDDRGREPIEFSETPRGYRARNAWARRYDELEGAPEGDWDR